MLWKNVTHLSSKSQKNVTAALTKLTNNVTIKAQTNA